MKNIAIFASGSGSNFEAIATAVKIGRINAKLSLLVCDKPEAPVISRAQRLGVPVFVCDSKQYASRENHEKRILSALEDNRVDFIVLAGYMRIIGKTLLEAYGGKIVNIHPSMLPDFPGINAIARAFESGAKATGVTVHYIDEGVDTGPIIAQRQVDILPGDTLEALEERVHRVEHELYINVLSGILGQ